MKANWNPIETAPENVRILVYWPTVKVDDYGDLTDELGEGMLFVSELQGDYWLEPNAVFEHGAHLLDDWEWTEAPSHWMPLPPLPAKAGG